MEKEKPLRLLLIDDDEFDREMVRRTLARSNLDCELLEAENGEEASQALMANGFDCILLDYLVPPTDGLDLLARLGDEHVLPAVVMLTGMGDEDVAVRAMRMGVDDYISKHRLSADTLCGAVRRAMQEKARSAHESERHEELERLSFYDELTGLPNRNLFLDRLAETLKTARRKKTSFALMLMDLNGFKDINDTLGHHAGDELLAEVGRRMAETSRESDTVARLGGDEFTVLLPDAGDDVSASIVANKLVQTISNPIQIDGREVTIGASIGIVLYPDHGRDHQTLMKMADKAMYEAKQGGLGFVIHGEKRSDSRDLATVPSLSRRSNTENVMLCFQPKVCLLSGACVGAEVLIRWGHPALGLLPPQKFIPAAEKSSLVQVISYEVMDMAVAQQAAWYKQNNPVPLSINLSSHLLSDPDMPAHIERIRLHHGVDAGQITLEITEAALINDPNRAQNVLEKFAGDGFQISVDDFGTGYSSLGYLRNYPIHEIKIDRSFVQPVQEDPMSGHIIDAALRLSRAFNARAVAEGIENQAVWDDLVRRGCVFGQGYYIGRPMPVDEFERWQAEWNRHHQAENTKRPELRL